jgi:hypothetical protein
MREDNHGTDDAGLSEEDLQTMRRNVMRHFVKFLFSGRAEALVYQVDEETSHRIRRNVSGTPSGFCRFTTLMVEKSQSIWLVWTTCTSSGMQRCRSWRLSSTAGVNLLLGPAGGILLRSRRRR